VSSNQETQAMTRRWVRNMFRNAKKTNIRKSLPAPLQVLRLEDRVTPSSDPLSQIDHFVVIYQENWSFDGLYAHFPGANTGPTGPGAPPGTSVTQVNKFGAPIASLPNPSTNPPVPGGLPVQTFDLSQYVAPSDKTKDIVHRFYTQQLQIDNGKIDTS